MKRRVAILVAVLTLVAGSLGMAGAAVAATPIAVDDAAVVQKGDGPVTIDVLGNDTVALDATITLVTVPAHGAAAIAADGRSLTYDPDQAYAGPDTFDYTVHDAVDGDDVGTVTIKVNAPPVAADNPASGTCDYLTSLSFGVAEDTTGFVAGGACNLLANDTDPDGTVVNWELVTAPAHGQVANGLPLAVPGLSSDFTYVPDADYFTAEGDWVSDSFTYRAVDNDGGRSAPATVRLWIGGFNDAPTFTPGPLTVTGAQGQAYSKPWATAISPGPGETGQTVHFEPDLPFTVPAGLFSVAPALSPTGTLSFTPAAGQTGTATVTFVAKDDGGLVQPGAQSGAPPAEDTSDPVTFTITISANVPPVAVDDPAIPSCMSNDFGGAFPMPEDWGQIALAYECSPIANDSDPDGSIVSWQVDTLPAHGTLEWNAAFPGVAGYTPDANYSTLSGDWVSDTFTYHVVDDQGASSNSATYRIWVSPINDAPTVTAGPASVQGAAGVAYSAPWATGITAGPAHESAQAVHFEGQVTPLGGSNPALFSVPPALAPDGTLTFTPAAGQTGYQRWSFVAKDDGGLMNPVPFGQQPPPDDTSDPVIVDITISEASDAPVAGDDAKTLAEDSGATAIDVLGNDTDANLDTLTITAVTQGAKGTVANVSGTGVTYRPNANSFGSDSFTYTISDGHGGTDTGTVQVTVTPLNDNPNAVNDVPATPYKVYVKGGPKAIPVLANDTWLPDAPETLTIIAVTNGVLGTVAITGGGTGLTYNAKGPAAGIDTFTYTISDGHGGTDTATVQVTVALDKVPPKATIISIQKTALAGRSGLRIYIHWSMTENETGLASQLFQRRTDSGSWVTVSLSSLTTRALSFGLPKGHTYTFRIRGTDKAGNVGVFAVRSITI